MVEILKDNDGIQRRKILLIASGFIYAPKKSRNLGDVAQQANTVNRLRRHLKGSEILAVATSLNDRTVIEGLNLSHRLAEYLLSQNDSAVLTRLLPRKALAALRAMLFVWNAKRLAQRRRTLLLSHKGVEALRELQSADGLVVSGAGAFNDRYASHAGFVWGIIMRSVAAFGRPVVISGQQIGPLNRLLSRSITRWALQVAEVVGVRDPISIGVATSLGIPKERIVLTGDDAWGLETSGEDEATRVLSRYGVTGPFIAAQIRLDPATELRSRDAPKLARALDGISQKFTLPIVFVRMYYAENNDDAVSAKKVQSFLEQHSMVIEEELSPSLTKSVLKKAQWAVGSSYHFCIFAVSAGTRTLGLYRSEYMKQKIEGISQMWPGHMAGLSLDEENIVDELCDRAESMKQGAASSDPHESLHTPYPIKEEEAISVLINALERSKEIIP